MTEPGGEGDGSGFRARVARLRRTWLDHPWLHAGLSGLHAERLSRADAAGLVPEIVLRLRRVLRLDGEVYRDIEGDRAGIPQALAVVIGSALLAGLGQGWPVLVFLGVAWALIAWLMSAALIWGVATLVLGRRVEYPRLLVGLGYAYVWTGLLLLARLPDPLGAAIGLAALGLCVASFVQASERALDVPRPRALGICAAALVLPFVLLIGALL